MWDFDFNLLLCILFECSAKDVDYHYRCDMMVACTQGYLFPITLVNMIFFSQKHLMAILIRFHALNLNILLEFFIRYGFFGTWTVLFLNFSISFSYDVYDLPLDDLIKLLIVLLSLWWKEWRPLLLHKTN